MLSQQRRTQELNKCLRLENADLASDNLKTSELFGRMKQMVLQYELHRIKYMDETEVFL